MKILAKQNRELIMTNAQNTQNENNAEKITLQVPEQYEDFNKKIVFVTPDGNVWDIITNNEYLIPKAITKYKQVDLYIWLTKGDVDFRSQTRTLKFYHNVDASGEITPEEISGVNTVVNLLEEEITKVENLESQIDGKLEEVDTAIDNIHTAIQETENLDLDAEKVGQTTTFTITNGEDGEVTETELDVLRQKVANQQKVIDQLPQVTGQGTSITLENTIEAQFTKFDVEGNSVQDGTPSPDNEVPILSAGDNGSITEKIANRNWNTSTLEIGGLTGGLPDTNYQTCRTKDFIDIKPNTNFAFSINGTLNKVVVSMYDKDKNFIGPAGGNGYVAANGLFTTYANVYYIKYRAYAADKQLFLNGNIQLEEGSTATPYVPHEEQDYSIPVQQPMRSIGDVRDCFVKVNGNWFERHWIKEFIVSQNTGINLHSINNYGIANFLMVFQDNDYDLTSIDNQLCNLFSKQNSLIATTETEGFLPTMNLATGLTGVYIRILSSRAKTVEEFKQWANTNNLKNYYILAEPLDLPCTPEQIQQLENLPSTYKDFTIIQSEDETPAYLEVAGIYDLNNLINN